jgi:hypothetical protein
MEPAPIAVPKVRIAISPVGPAGGGGALDVQIRANIAAVVAAL